MHTPTPPADPSAAPPDPRSRAFDTMLFPPMFTVAHWDDPLVERVGFDLRHPYIELVLLPVVGPTVTCCLRVLAAWTLPEPDGVTVRLVELAEALGLSRSTGARDSAVQRTLRRMLRFGLAEWSGSTLRVRTIVAPVAGRDLIRLSPRIRRIHERAVARRADPNR